MAFHYAYAAYLRSAHATEHLILSFIRMQDNQASASTPIPSRLKSWIKGYPSMLVPLEKLDKERLGTRTLRVSSVRRNVRLYSPDLVKTCASWGKILSVGPHPGDVGGGGGNNDLRHSKVWERIVPPDQLLSPKYSDAYKKRMDLSASVVPEYGRSAASNLSNTSSTASSVSTTSTLSSSTAASSIYSTDTSAGRVGEERGRFRNLTDLKWGVFEESGFSEPDLGKLQFDLNESARSVSVFFFLLKLYLIVMI